VVTPPPRDVARIEDVTEAYLGGVASQASPVEPAAIQAAVLELVLDVDVPEWTAIAVVWDGGTWRGVVPERCRLPWTLAQRLTAEERRRPGGVGHKRTDDRA
jgi:hypothetical protein